MINIGMLFFLFVAGLEVDLTQVRRNGLSVVLTGILGGFGPIRSGIRISPIPA